MFVITVPASKTGQTYTVRMVDKNLWVCDCPDHVNRSAGKPYVCKHIASLVASLVSHTDGTTMSTRAADILGLGF